MRDLILIKTNISDISGEAARRGPRSARFHQHSTLPFLHQIGEVATAQTLFLTMIKIATMC
jgi:hypothetical protein